MKISTIVRFTSVALLLSIGAFAHAQQSQSGVPQNRLANDGKVSITMMDMPASLVAGSGMFSISLNGLNEQKRTITPKAGYALLRLGVLLDFPPPGIKVRMNSFQLRSASKEPIRPIHFFTNFDESFEGGLSLVGATVGPVERSTKGVVFVVPKTGIDDLELVVEGVSGGTIGEFRIAIRAAQKRLLELGYAPGPADGVWGPKTANAVTAFQKKSELNETGRLDSETLDRLMSSK